MAEMIDQLNVPISSTTWALYDINLPKDASVTVASLYVTGSFNGGQVLTLDNMAALAPIVVNGVTWPGTNSVTIYGPTSQISINSNKRYLLGSTTTTNMYAVNTNANCYMQSGYLYSYGKQINLGILSAQIGSANVPVYLSGDANGNYFSTCSTYAGGTRVTLNGTDKGSSTATIYAPSSYGAAGAIWAGTGTVPAWFATVSSSVDFSVVCPVSTATDVPTTLPSETVTVWCAIARTGPANAIISVHLSESNKSADRHIFIPMSTFSSFCDTNSRVMAIIANPARNSTASGNCPSLFTRWWNSGSGNSLYNQEYGSVAWSSSLYALVTLDENAWDGFNALIMISGCKYTN